MESASESHFDTSGGPEHWNSYWTSEAEFGEHRNPIARQLQVDTLLEIVATGDVEDVASNHKNEFNNLGRNAEDRPQTAGDAAWELFLRLGPDNEMGKSDLMLTALAGRIVEDAVGTLTVGDREIKLVPDSAYEQDFFGDTDGNVTATARALFTTLSPGLFPMAGGSRNELPKQQAELFKTVEDRLKTTDPDLLTRASEVLADAYFSTETPQLKNFIAQTVRTLNTAVENNPNAEPADLARASNVAFDIAFENAAAQDYGPEQYDQLMKAYAGSTVRLISQVDNGTAHELLVPLMARYSAFYDGKLSAEGFTHSTRRADAPHDGRSAKSGQRRSTDIVSTHRLSGEQRGIQLKANSEDQTGAYDTRFVDVYDGGLSAMVARLPAEARDRIYSDRSAENRFVRRFQRSVAEKIGSDFGITNLGTNEKLKGEFGLDINDYATWEALEESVMRAVSGWAEEREPVPA